MEPFEYLKALVLNGRLNSCCWCVPVRIGLIGVGYLNGIIATFSVLGLANDSISTTLMQVQMKIMPDYITKSVVLLAYITEVCFSVLCLCGIYRKDLVLLRAYMYYCASALMLSIMVYSIVILAIDIIIQIIMISGILFQVYVLLLVRSAIVEIKLENKQSNLPTLVLSSLIHEKEPLKDQISIKSHKDDQEKHEIEEVKVETVEVKSETEKVKESSSETETKNGTKKDITEKKNGTKKNETEKNNLPMKDEIDKKIVSKKAEDEKKNETKKDVDVKLETVKEEVSTSAENKSSSARRVFLRP